MYRLLADVLNDIAFILDCLSPAFPKPVRVVILSFSSILRALCGVAAGSAKASLSAHFARWGNLGELNAKDSSQETVISLLGMLAGSLVVSWVTTPLATWTTLIFLLSVHLETNRRAVRAVSMRTLNRQRATLVYHHLQRGHVPTPEEVSKQERIFERGSVLRGGDGQLLGYCNVGVSMSRILAVIGTQHSRTKSIQITTDLRQSLAVFRDQHYILWYTSSSWPTHLSIVIKKEASATDLLIAWWQALALVATAKQESKAQTPRLEMLYQSKWVATSMFTRYAADLKVAGWDLDTGALETTSTTRVSITD